jgi:phosphatidylglycerophosphate synthase
MAGILKALLDVLSFLLHLVGAAVADPVVQHIAVIVAIGYVIAHSFSRAFRHDVTVAEHSIASKVGGFFGKVAHPLVLVVLAFRNAFAGFSAGLKDEKVVVVVPPKAVPVTAPAATVPAQPSK